MDDFKAIVTAVHDGDTLTARIDLPLGLSLTDHVRLVGIDAPELPTPEGVAAQQHLSDLVLLREVRIRMSHEVRDKYGRLLAEVFDDLRHPGVSVNSEMLRSRLAVPYLGTKRI